VDDIRRLRVGERGREEELSRTQRTVQTVRGGE